MHLTLHQMRHYHCWLWRRDMETFSVLLVICAVNQSVIGNIFSQRDSDLVILNFEFFFVVRLNKKWRHVIHPTFNSRSLFWTVTFKESFIFKNRSSVLCYDIVHQRWGGYANVFIAIMCMVSTGCIGGALHSTELIDANNPAWWAVGFIVFIFKAGVCITEIEDKEDAIRMKGQRDYAGQ